MRFISIYKPSNLRLPTHDDFEKMGKFIEEALRKGVLLATEGFGPSTAADMRVRLGDGVFTVTDGPFAETKEIIAGFAIMQTATREEMLEWTRRFLALAGDGEAEVHQLHDMSPVEQLKAQR